MACYPYLIAVLLVRDPYSNESFDIKNEENRNWLVTYYIHILYIYST